MNERDTLPASDGQPERSLLQDHAEFRFILHDFLKEYPGKDDDSWLRLCYESAEEFAKRFPTGADRREIIDRQKEGVALQLAFREELGKIITSVRLEKALSDLRMEDER